MMYALVEWIDEEKYSTISLTRVKEPRKELEKYEIGEVVKASCHGFPGIHNAKILAIKDATLDGKKELERITEEYIASKSQANDENKQQPSEDLNNNSCSNSSNGTSVPKRVRKSTSTLTKEDGGPKKARMKSNKENGAEQEKRKEEAQKKKDNNQKKKEEAIKKREENQKKKELALRRNSIFLQSLDVFRQETQQEEPISATVPVTTQVNQTMPPQTSYAEPLQPAAYQQPAPYTHQPNPYSQQLAYQPMMPAAYPQMPFNQEAQPRPYNQTTPTQMSHTPMPPRQLFAAQPQQTSDLYSLVEIIPGMESEVAEGEKILNNFMTRTSEERQSIEVSNAQDDVKKYKTALEESKKRVEELEKKLEAVQRELETLRRQQKAGTSTEWKTQCDGLPRAGVVPKEIAENNAMMELMSNSGVYVYPRDIRTVSRKTNGTTIARHLMSVFYTTKELIERGNVNGVNGKVGMDKAVVKAIVDYAVIKGKESEPFIKAAMRSKISALISFQKKKVSAVEQ